MSNNAKQVAKFDRTKPHTADVTITSTSYDGKGRSTFYFHIQEADAICQTNAKGDDELTDVFSKGFSCILDFLSGLTPIQDLKDDICGNVFLYTHVENVLFIVLEKLNGVKAKITRQWFTKGTVYNERKVTRDMWITTEIVFDEDDLKAVNKSFEDKETRRRLNRQFAKIELIEDDDEI